MGNRRGRRLRERLHGDEVEWLALVEQGVQRARDIGFGCACREVQDAGVLDVGTIAAPGAEGVVTAPERQRREQVLAVRYAANAPGLRTAQITWR
jgi:hypothetical protein